MLRTKPEELRISHQTPSSRPLSAPAFLALIVIERIFLSQRCTKSRRGGTDGFSRTQARSWERTSVNYVGSPYTPQSRVLARGHEGLSRWFMRGLIIPAGDVAPVAAQGGAGSDTEILCITCKKHSLPPHTQKDSDLTLSQIEGRVP
jgi:hypothetical protein